MLAELHHANDLPVINVGTGTKPLFVPAELCFVEASRIGQSAFGQTTVEMKRIMTSISRAAPREVSQDLKIQGYQALKLNDRAGLLSVFGITVPNDLLEVKGRLMEPPVVSYAAVNASINNGSWHPHDKAFKQAASNAFENAAVLALLNDDPDDHERALQELRDMVLHIQNALAACGVAIQEDLFRATMLTLPKAVDKEDPRFEAVDIIKGEGIDFLSRRRKPSILFVLLEDYDDHIFPHIKTICDTERGIPTVCIETRSLRAAVVAAKEGKSPFKVPGQPHLHPTFINLAMKANAKVGGINHQIDFGNVKMLESAMLVGVSRDSRKDQPSVAGVVASIDKLFLNYPASLRLQDESVRASSRNKCFAPFQSNFSP